MISMKRVLLLMILASLCLTAAAQVQPVSVTTSVAKTYRQFDDEIKDGTYSNHYFGLNYKLPTGYVAQDQETRDRILEAGREAMKRDKEAAAAGPERGFFMLMIATPEDKMVPQISLMAQDVLLVPQIKSGAEFVNATGDALVQQGFTISYDESGSDVKVTFRQGKKEFTAPATLQQTNSEPTNALVGVSTQSGSRELKSLQLAGKKSALTFDGAAAGAKSSAQ
jgi:opacity protein-like surface antigen